MTTPDAEKICYALDHLRDSGSPFDQLLAHAVEMLHAANPLFHWTGIYELYPDQVLRLGPFIGAPTDHVFIAVGRGVCGTAVAEKRNINVPDVSKATNYLACSAATRSELVVLIRRGERIFAQIDIDSHEPDAFGPEAVALVERVADWLSGAYVRRAQTPPPASP
ncbi:MAG TPA: GAF domain-containing protein [Candidatus Polarisedimenticolia bacterium]|nr:GAF domain-containing protein [Candidatus Polarisedimenticolia bacterium]